MKCDELKVYFIPIKKSIMGLTIVKQSFYTKSEVDAAIAELKEKLDKTIAERDGNQVCIDALNAKLENVQATAYTESVDAGMRERRLKRALWIAHANKAKFKRWWLHLALDYEASMIRPNTKTINRIRGKIGNCEKSERKCRAKAEEYK